MRSLLVLLGLVLCSSLANAITDPISYAIYRGYYAPRALGMGDAFVGLADDYNALYYNPAGLARLKEGEMNFKIQGGISPATLSFSKDVQTATGGNKTDAQKVQDVSDLLQRNYGSHHWVGFPTLGGTWVRPGWGIGFIPVQTNIDIDILQQGGPAMAVEGYVDSTLAFGYAKSFIDDTLSIGATAKAIHRGYVGKVVQSAELIGNSDYLSERDFQEGLTFDIDIGTLYSPHIGDNFLKYMKPTFAIVGKNLADYGFKTNLHLLNKNSTEAPKLGRRADVGSSWQLPEFWVFKPRFLFDVRDIGTDYFTFRKGLHTGFELGWTAFNWLKGGYRVGLNQGYFAAGVSAQLAWFLLDVATWGEEVGTTGAPKENRRYVLQASLDF